MAGKLGMVAKSSTDGKLYPWLSAAPDFAGAGWASPGSPLDICVTGGVLDDSASVVGQLTDDSGAAMTDDSGAAITDG